MCDPTCPPDLIMWNVPTTGCRFDTARRAAEELDDALVNCNRGCLVEARVATVDIPINRDQPSSTMAFVVLTDPSIHEEVLSEVPSLVVHVNGRPRTIKLSLSRHPGKRPVCKLYNYNRAAPGHCRCPDCKDKPILSPMPFWMYNTGPSTSTSIETIAPIPRPSVTTRSTQTNSVDTTRSTQTDPVDTTELDTLRSQHIRDRRIISFYVRASKPN